MSSALVETGIIRLIRFVRHLVEVLLCIHAHSLPPNRVRNAYIFIYSTSNSNERIKNSNGIAVCPIAYYFAYSVVLNFININ